MEPFTPGRAERQRSLRVPLERGRRIWPFMMKFGTGPSEGGPWEETCFCERGCCMGVSRRGFLKAAGIAPVALLVGCQTKTAGGRTSSGTGTSDGGGCEPDTAAAKPCPPKTAAKKPGTCVLCWKCGQVKGSAKCCQPGAAKCSRCGLHKGSPGCCRLGGAKAPVCLCTYCGQIKGSDKCCKAGARKCASCGLNAGSPGCCRIKKEDPPTCM